jgi:hypothetical protein
MPTDLTSRVLRKNWGGTTWSWDGDSATTATLVDNTGSWETTTFDPTGALPTCLVYRIDYFDLSGYELEDETVYPQTTLIGDMEFLQGQSTGTGASIRRLDLVCTKVPTVEDLNNWAIGGGWLLPGSSQSRFGLEEIIFGRITKYVQTVDVGEFQPLESRSWGAGDSTAGQKLFFVQAYLTQNTITAGVIIPSSSIVIPTVIGKEPELEYMMRLYRSYEQVS